MKVTVENKKGLEKDIKVFIDKKTISGYLEEKYEEIKKDVVLKGFRPGKVPTEILKRQFGKAVYGEVIDKVLKDTTTKALEDNKIKPAGQPKIDLKSFGEGKDLEYTISVTELPNVEVGSLKDLKVDEYVVKIDPKETDKRIDQIAKTQKNFKDAEENYAAKVGDLVVFDYKATVDGKDFKGNEGKNTQLELGKDLFIKGFDKQLEGVKNKQDKKVEVKLPENFPEKEVANKSASFECKITAVRKPEETKIDDKKLTKLNAKDAKRNKAKILEYNKVKKAEIIGNEWIISLEKGEKVKSKILINASGPWINETLNKNIKIKSKKKIRLVKGSHIITKKLYKENVAFTFQNTDKRIIFVIPYKGKFSLIGTTEVEVKSPENKGISKKEITYLIRSVNNYLKKQIRTKDIVDTYSGIRPLIEDFNTASKVTRDYVFDLKIIKKLPLLNIYGGKLTTYRKLSEKVLFDLRKFLPKTKKGPWTHKKKLL